MSVCATTIHRARLLNCLWTPTVEHVRFRNRPNLKNPLPPHLDRARMLRLCEPQYPPPLRICDAKADAESRWIPMEDNPYGVFLAKVMRKDFYDHSMIAIYHINSHHGHEVLRTRGLFFDTGLPIEWFKINQNREVARMALTGTKFEPALRLLKPPFGLMYFKSTDVRTLVQLSKKLPSFILIGVLMDDRLMQKSDFEMYADNALDSVRASFSNTLSLAGGSGLSRNLVAGVQALSHSLNTYASSKDSPDNPSETPATDNQTEAA